MGKILITGIDKKKLNLLLAQCLEERLISNYEEIRHVKKHMEAHNLLSKDAGPNKAIIIGAQSLQECSKIEQTITAINNRHVQQVYKYQRGNKWIVEILFDQPRNNANFRTNWMYSKKTGDIPEHHNIYTYKTGYNKLKYVQREHRIMEKLAHKLKQITCNMKLPITDQIEINSHINKLLPSITKPGNDKTPESAFNFMHIYNILKAKGNTKTTTTRIVNEPSTEYLTVMSHNIGGRAQDKLQPFTPLWTDIQLKQPHVIIIQETQKKRNMTLQITTRTHALQGYKLIHTEKAALLDFNKGRPSGGTLIYLHHSVANMHNWRIDYSDHYITAFTLTNKTDTNKTYKLINYYLNTTYPKHGHKRYLTNWFNNLQTAYETNKHPNTILGGDINTSTDPTHDLNNERKQRRKFLEIFLKQNKLQDLNTKLAKDQNTFLSNKGCSITDLYLTEAVNMPHWIGLEITDLAGYDISLNSARHATLTATSTIPIQTKEKNIQVAYAINYNIADYRCFNSLWHSKGSKAFKILLKIINKKVTHPQIRTRDKETLLSQAQLLFFGIIHILAIRACGLRKITNKENNTLYNSQALASLRQNYFEATSTTETNNKDRKQKLQQQLAEAINKEKKEKWNKTLQRAQNQSMTQVYQNYAKAKLQHKIQVEEKLVGITGELRPAAQAYQEYCETTLFKKPDNLIHLPQIENPKTENKSTEQIITLENINKTIEDLKPGKSPGISGIPINLYKYSEDLLRTNILDWFRLLQKTEIIPLTLKLDIKNPHPKYGPEADQKTKQDTVNHRPITLQNNLYKILDGNIKIAAEEHNKLYNIIQPEQGGFKREEGTIEHMFVLQNIYHKNNKIYAAFLDLRKAYDSVWREALFMKLEQDTGLPTNLIKLIKAMYNKTTSTVKANKLLSKCFKTTRGLQQGALSSPILFNFFINDLIIDLKKTNIGLAIGDRLINCLLFADDVLICAPTENALQELLDICSNWANKWNFTFNHSKSQLVSSTGNIKPKTLQNRIIKQAPGNCYKYLGFPVTATGIDVEAYLLKRRKAFYMNYTIMKHYARQKALNLQHRVNIYKGVVRSQYDYGLALLDLTTQETTKLEKDQQRALQGLLNLPTNTAYHTTLALSGIPSMAYRLDQSKITFMAKLTKKWGNSISREVYEQLTKRPGISVKHMQRSQPLAVLKKSINKYHLSGLIKQQNNWPLEKFKKFLKKDMLHKELMSYNHYLTKQHRRRNKIPNGWVQTPLWHIDQALLKTTLETFGNLNFKTTNTYIPTSYFNGKDNMLSGLAYCDNNPDWFVRQTCPHCNTRGVTFKGQHDLATCPQLNSLRLAIKTSLTIEIRYFSKKYKQHNILTEKLDWTKAKKPKWFMNLLLGNMINHNLKPYQINELRKMFHSHLYLLSNSKAIAKEANKIEDYTHINEDNTNLWIHTQDLKRGKIIVRNRTPTGIKLINIRHKILNLEITKLENYNIGLGAASTRTAQQKIMAQKYTDKIIAQIKTNAIVTDGSIHQKEEKGGIGIVHFSPEKKIMFNQYHLRIDTDDAQVAELAGLLRSVQICEEIQEDITILCDCKTAINYIKHTFTPPFKYANLVQQIQETLWKIRNKSKQKINLVWIPGHTDNTWNDAADALAKKAANNWTRKGNQASPEFTMNSDN